MAGSKSEERRQAIIDSAIKLITRDGLGPATAAIAKEAGVTNGSVFTYSPTNLPVCPSGRAGKSRQCRSLTRGRRVD